MDHNSVKNLSMVQKVEHDLYNIIVYLDSASWAPEGWLCMCYIVHMLTGCTL